MSSAWGSNVESNLAEQSGERFVESETSRSRQVRFDKGQCLAQRRFSAPALELSVHFVLFLDSQKGPEAIELIESLGCIKQNPSLENAT